MLVKHPALALAVKMLVQRLQRSDDMAAKCIEMLDFLAFSRKFIRVLGSDKAFGEVILPSRVILSIKKMRTWLQTCAQRSRESGGWQHQVERNSASQI